MSTLLDPAVITIDLPDIELDPITDPADPIKAHMVSCPPEWESSEVWLAHARLNRLPVKALCGVVFVPSRNPMRHPVCDPCIDEFKARLERASKGEPA